MSPLKIRVDDHGNIIVYRGHTRYGVLMSRDEFDRLCILREYVRVHSSFDATVVGDPPSDPELPFPR